VVRDGVFDFADALPNSTSRPMTSRPRGSRPLAVVSEAAQITRGNSHKPPQRPCKGRRTIRNWPTGLRIKAALWVTLTVARPGGSSGRALGSGPLPATQSGRRGQRSHLGSEGSQSSAPNSIRPWLKSPGASSGTSCSASGPEGGLVRRRFRIAPQPEHALRTRTTLASTRRAWAHRRRWRGWPRRL